jgi:hypothetical protein
MMGVSLQFRLAAMLLWLSGAGFGLPCIQWGFALPFGPIVALVRTFLIVQRWGRFT